MTIRALKSRAEIFNADRRIEEDLSIDIGQNEGAGRRPAPGPS